MQASSGDGHGAPSAAELDWWQSVAHLARATTSVVGVAEAQLARCIQTKALDVTVVQESAGVQSAGSNGYSTSPRAQRHRRQCVAHLSRDKNQQVTQAELPEKIVAKALEHAEPSGASGGIEDV